MYVAGVDGRRAGWVCFRVDPASRATTVVTWLSEGWAAVQQEGWQAPIDAPLVQQD